MDDAKTSPPPAVSRLTSVVLPPRRNMPVPQVLLSFDGRIPRRTYWLWKLVTFSPLFAFAGFLFLSPDPAGRLFPRMPEPGTGQTMSAVAATLLLAEIVAGITAFAFVIRINVALNLKRWHDLGKSGPSFSGMIPYLGFIVSLFECFCLPGTPGPNQFGEDPT